MGTAGQPRSIVQSISIEISMVCGHVVKRVYLFYYCVLCCFDGYRNLSLKKKKNWITSVQKETNQYELHIFKKRQMNINRHINQMKIILPLKQK